MRLWGKRVAEREGVAPRLSKEEKEQSKEIAGVVRTSGEEGRHRSWKKSAVRKEDEKG